MELKKICQELSKTRNQKGLSLEDISIRTKLPAHLIRKIENLEDLEILGEFYIKGFLKIYADFLGRKDLLAKIQELYPDKKNQKQKPQPQQTLKQKPQQAQPKKKIAPLKNIDLTKIKLDKRLPKLIGFLVLFLFVFFSIKMCSGKEKQQPAPKIKPEQKIYQQPEKLTPVQQPANQPIASVLTKGKVFIEVTADNTVVFSNILDKQIKESWKAKKELKIKISNPSLVSLEITGQIIPTSNQRKPVIYIITPSGFSVEK